MTTKATTKAAPRIPPPRHCAECGGRIRRWVATADAPYHYTLSGLHDVYLVGVQVRTCDGCGAEGVMIPRLGELRDTIARTLADKPSLLRGDEVRFLRKYGGFSSNDFARLLGVDRSHLSRVENAKTQHLGAPSDRLARALALIARDSEAARAALLEAAPPTRATKAAPRGRRFAFRGRRWRAAA